MFKKAGIEQKIEQKKTIKTYKKFLEEKRYTGKKIKHYEEIMTMHHLRHRSEEGKTDIQNGSVVNSLAHTYMHSLPREQEEYINNELREYKRQHSKECPVEFVDYLPLDWEVKAMVFTPKELQPKKKYNRAKDKREFMKRVEEEYER